MHQVLTLKEISSVELDLVKNKAMITITCNKHMGNKDTIWVRMKAYLYFYRWVGNNIVYLGKVSRLQCGEIRLGSNGHVEIDVKPEYLRNKDKHGLTLYNKLDYFKAIVY